MKKLISLLMALCLVLLGSAALADTQTSDGTPLVLDGFTLNLEEGVMYDLAEKNVGEVYILVYPLAAQGDMATNYNIVWFGDDEKLTLEDVREFMPSWQSQVEEGFKATGLEVSDLKMSEPEELSLKGEPSATFINSMTLSLSGAEIGVIQRLYFVYNKGLIISISAQTEEIMDQVSAGLESTLAW